MSTHIRRRHRAVAAVLACLPGAVAAQSAAEAVPLAPVEVEASRTHSQWFRSQTAVSVFEAGDWSGARHLALDEALNRAPGVFAQNRYNFSQGLRVAIRGFGARAAFGVRGIRVLVDGVPLTMPDGQTELDGFDLSLVDRVEVIRGPASTLYGNAAGGVLALSTLPPPEQAGGQLDYAGGEPGFSAFHARAGGSWDRWAALAAASRLRSDGPREHGRGEADSLSGKLVWQGAAGMLRMHVNAIDNQSQDPGGLTAAEVAADRGQAAPRNLQFDAGESIEQQRLGLSWDGAAADADYRVWLYAGQRDFANRLPFEDGGQSAFARDFGGAGAQLGYATGWLGRPQHWTVGLDLEAQRDERRRYDNLDGGRGEQTLHQDESADAAGLFVQGEFELAPRVDGSLGLRRDRLELEVEDRYLTDGDDSGRRSLSEWSLAAGLGYALTSRHRLYARYSDSFESPTINELANPAGGGFNPDLAPAKARNRELGVKGLLAAARYELALYSIQLDDELVSYEIEGESGRSYYRNAGESSRDGAEAALDWRLSEVWRLYLAYSYARNRFDEYRSGSADHAGNTVPGLPRQQLFAEIAWTGGPWRARGNIFAWDRLYADDANAVRVGGAALVNLRLSRRWAAGGIEWLPYLGVDNLLDREHYDNVRINAGAGRYFEPGPGRSVYAGLQASF